MNELKTTIKIIKTRFAEISLILGLYAMAVIATTILEKGDKDIGLRILAVLLFTAFVALTHQFLLLGFLKTTEIKPFQPRLPFDLLVIGRHFFWRIVIFSLCFAFVLILLGQLLFTILQGILHLDIQISQMSGKHILYRLSTTAVMAILAKPLIFIPAIIIACDQKLYQSIQNLKNFKFLKANPIIYIFAAELAMILAFESLPEHKNQVLNTTLLVSAGLVNHFLHTVVAIMAVRYVSRTAYRKN